jgi:hypothetical protein
MQAFLFPDPLQGPGFFSVNALPEYTAITENEQAENKAPGDNHKNPSA